MKPTLELSMIVKNGAAGLARCLESVKGIVDRITLGDTGSTDETLEIAGRYGAHIVSVPWTNDFALARNVVLAHAKCDWILSLDADEMLAPQAAAQIAMLMADPAIAGYDVTTWNYVLDPGFRSSGEQAVLNPCVSSEASTYPAYFPSRNTRLFRRLPGLYFEHCVHETVADRIDALGLRRTLADLVVHHFGYVEDAVEKRSQKEDLYYSLALKKVSRSKNNYQANLGAGIAELDHAKNAAAALPYFKRSIALDARRPSAWLYSGICLTRLGDYSEALSHIKRAFALDPESALAFNCLGDVLFQQGDHSSARIAYLRAIERGDLSPLSGAKLGACEVHLGLREEGLKRVANALAQSPENGELCNIFATSAFLAGQPGRACEAAERRLAMKDVSAFNYFLAATLHLHTNQRQKAEDILVAGSRTFPEDTEISNMLASFDPTSA